MLPVGPLMIEHRLIEKMLERVSIIVEGIEQEHSVNPVLIDTIVDFIRMYADRTHHGKEEDILFRDLSTRDLTADERRIMAELVEEHKTGRRLTAELVVQRERYVSGDNAALEGMAASLRELCAFYPEHIRKEDVGFFIPVMRHFTRQELDAIIAEMWKFDRQMIHEKYRAVVDALAG
jgi:hemerythrin-like domain-containing protein